MKHFIILIALVIGAIQVSAQDSTLLRKYSLSAYNQNDLRNSANNGLTVHRVLTDGFRKGIAPKMNEKAGNVASGVYSFAVTYLAMIWSHELGHSLRADQIGGKFKIHNGNLPIPYTTMHLPVDVALEDEALSVTGGFEVNHLNVLNIQREFIQQNGHFNEDLAYAWANRLMYTIYTTMITPRDPTDPETWIKTAGDPVHCVLPVFKNYSNGQVFMGDSSVNPELVDFYNQSVRFGAFWQLLDPQFYRELGATFGDVHKQRKPTFLIGDHNTGWTYGTLFNTTPLGYELYLNNYLHINGKQMGLVTRYGKPYKNMGVGVFWNNIVQTNKMNLGGSIDVWDQDLFGQGVAVELSSSYKLSDRFAIDGVLGYKTEGYVMGKQLGSGLNLGFGVSYFTNY